MEAMNISIADLLGSRHESRSTKSRPLHEAQVMALQEAYDIYKAGCPFKPGDLVTPRETSGYTNAGEPHIVLEVLDEPIRNFTETTDLLHNSSGFGSRLDIRVAVLASDGFITPFWQESYRVKPYVDPEA